MKKIVALMVTALMTLSLSLVAVAAEPKKEAAPAVPAAEKAEKKDAKKEKKAPAKKEAAPAKKGKKEMSGC